MLYLIIAILGFGVLIAVHEAGHFASAKLLGVQVNEFSIGMGPALVSRQKGETLYSLRLLPIGGYCAMEGEDESSDNPRAFGNQARWKQLVILVAGSFMNYAAGFVLVLILMAGAAGFSSNTLAGFMDGFPLEGEAGLMAGDRIVKIGGAATHTLSDVRMQLARQTGDTMDLVVVRDGRRVALDDLPLTMREYEYQGTKAVQYGLIFESEENSPLTALRYSWWECVYFVRSVWYGLLDLLTGRAGVKDLAGPIGIVATITQVGSSASSVAEGVSWAVEVIALIAINLAVMNLLPIPALDGGRVFFLVLNWLCLLIFKRRIPEKYENYIHMAGLVLLLILMAVVALNDVLRLVR